MATASFTKEKAPLLSPPFIRSLEELILGTYVEERRSKQFSSQRHGYYLVLHE